MTEKRAVFQINCSHFKNLFFFNVFSIFSMASSQLKGPQFNSELGLLSEKHCLTSVWISFMFSGFLSPPINMPVLWVDWPGSVSSRCE